MNYADFGMGTWHPKTGMFDVVRAMESLARELGVTFHTNSTLKKIVKNKTATAIVVNGETITSDLVLSGADYHHTETLLDKEFRFTQKNIGTVEFLLLHLYCSMLVLIKN
jgi:phytoene desaturase